MIPHGVVVGRGHYILFAKTLRDFDNHLYQICHVLHIKVVKYLTFSKVFYERKNTLI